MNYLLTIDDDLKYAYRLKEKYHEFSKTASFENCNEEFDELIAAFTNSHLEEFRAFGNMIRKWRPFIQN